MAAIPTKKLFDEFFKGKDPDTVRKTKAQVDRPEVYEYEAKIGKQLVDMNEEELFEMICSFNNKKSAMREGIKVGSASFKKYASNFRMIFQFYIDNYEVIKNPFHSDKFKGIQAQARLSDNKNRFTKEKLEEIIDKLYATYSHEYANYYELILRLFYDGFADAQEIVGLKEDQINFRRKEARLAGRTVKLSDRCFDLLTIIHNMEIMEGTRGNFYMMPWHDSYFKFVVRPKESTDFQNKDITYAGRKIYYLIFHRVAKEYEVDITARKLYLLGFYDALIERYGEEHTKKIIMSKRNQNDNKDLTIAMNEYGLIINDITNLKENLIQFT